METRRFILALSLSFIVFLIYIRFFAPKPPVEQPVPQQRQEVERTRVPARAEEVAAPKFAPKAKGREVIVETDLIKAVINTSGGVITKWELKKYKEVAEEETGIKALYKKLFSKGEDRKPSRTGNVQLVPSYLTETGQGHVMPLALLPLEKGLEPVSYAEYIPSIDGLVLTGDKESGTIALVYRGPSGVFVEKRLTFRKDDYKVDVSISTRNIDGYRLSLGTDFGIADKLSKNAAGRVGVTALVDGSTVSALLNKIKLEHQVSGRVDWFGQYDKYFTAALLTSGQGISTSVKEVGTKETGDFLTSYFTVKEQSGSREFGLYAGPKSYSILKSYGAGLERMVDYGWFAVLAKPMFWLLERFYGVTKNYGIAIILLTIVVRIFLFYPSLKSAMAMEEMKALQPELNAIREKYKKDPQKMNQEMMRLYKEKKVNPVGGCLPMLLQLPFFVALYNVLNVSIELRQAPFISFWIKDLSVHDPYYILPVLMGVSMIVTMKITSTTADPAQQKMFMFMNVLFIFLFAWLPAGLLLYITLSNVLSVVQQLIVKRMIAAPASS